MQVDKWGMCKWSGHVRTLRHLQALWAALDRSLLLVQWPHLHLQLPQHIACGNRKEIKHSLAHICHHLPETVGPSTWSAMCFLGAPHSRQSLPSIHLLASSPTSQVSRPQHTGWPRPKKFRVCLQVTQTKHLSVCVDLVQSHADGGDKRKIEKLSWRIWFVEALT